MFRSFSIEKWATLTVLAHIPFDSKLAHIISLVCDHRWKYNSKYIIFHEELSKVSVPFNLYI